MGGMYQGGEMVECEKFNVGDKFYFDNVTSADEQAEMLVEMRYGVSVSYDPYTIEWIVTIIEMPREWGREEDEAEHNNSMLQR